ncbi:hypothetical protein EsDP_00007049 [Epichloe bromicola]|uniref:Cell wall protein n=1 Tax=Epichloe bromicola TaxID=79588 RepID=A0ABQ0CZE7_9HYPO
MKFLILTTLASTAFGAALYERDLATIKAAMTAAGTDIVGLDNSVKGFSGDPNSLLSASNKLIQTLKDGKAKVDPSSSLSLAEALGLQEPAKDLQSKGDALLASLKSKKDAIAAKGLCEATFTQASGVNTASKALIDSVVSKVPEAAQGIAKGIVAGLLKDLKEAEDTFSPANCKNSGTAPSAAPTSAAPTEAPPTTAPPAPTVTTPPAPTVTNPPGTNTDTCPAAPTVTVTEIDSSHCCTKKAPVTVTTTKKACPTKNALLRS